MPTIAVIGGTGPEGRGLALRFAMAGHPVVIGSRDESRASEAAAGLLEIAGTRRLHRIGGWEGGRRNGRKLLSAFTNLVGLFSRQLIS